MNQLKLIAMAIMLIDHFAVVVLERGIGLYGEWYQRDLVLRSIGRIAFPIFCFSIVEGFQKTSNAKAYLKRLVIFALISEIPFDLALSGKLFSIGYENVFWTLAFGLAALICITDREMAQWKKMLGFALCILLPFLLHTDYSFYGVLTIVLMYELREQPAAAYLAGLVVLVLQNPTEIWAAFGFLLLFFYNGERGRGNKYLFYGFYPLHLLLLVLLKPWLCSLL